MAKSKAQKPIFTQVSEAEVKLEYKGHKFLLKNQRQGVYSGGRAILLHKIKEDLTTEYMKTLGWLRGDGYDAEKKVDNFITGITTWDKCKEAAIQYLDTLI